MPTPSPNRVPPALAPRTAQAHGAYDVQYADSQVVLDEVMAILYGESGIGKTTAACHFPDPLFLVFRGGGEHRPLPLIRHKHPFVEIHTKDQLDRFVLDSQAGTVRLSRMAEAASLPEAIDKVARGDAYASYAPKAYVFDQLTTLYNVLMNHVMQNVTRNRENADTPSQQDYQQARRLMMNFFFEISKVPNVHKVFLALEEIDRDQDTKEQRGVPSVPGKLAYEVSQYVDFVFHMHATRVMDQQTKRVREFRAFATAKHGLWLAKDSSGRLPALIESTGPDFSLWDFIHSRLTQP